MGSLPASASAEPSKLTTPLEETSIVEPSPRGMVPTSFNKPSVF
jgi:hypothetical protein